MECDRIVVVCMALLLVNVSISVSESSEKNVSSASVKLDLGLPRFRANNPAEWFKTDYVRYSSDVPQNYTNCSGLQMLNVQNQPNYSPDTSFIRKCCPLGQSYEQTDNGKKCTPDNSSAFSISVLNATFYENCIEDNEFAPNLEYQFTDACNSDEISNQKTLYTKSFGDLLYVLQNGSLLTVDENFESYDVHDSYCLDIDRNGSFLYAIVCTRKPESNSKNRVLHAEAYLYSTCLLISVPCLLLTAFFYVKIGELRDLHGKSLACHSVCLAIAYTLLSIVQLQPNISFLITYCIQYFLLACICWLNALCFDICMKILHIYIKKYSCPVNTEDKYFLCYGLISFVLPILPVYVAASRNISGIPLSYIKGQHNIDSLIENYFILPAAFLLFFCGCTLLITFYAFERRKPILPNENITPQLVSEYEEFFKLKQTAQSVAFLFLVMAICMVIEITVSQLNAAADTTTTMSPFAFFDILIALQGVFIFMIFICSPKPLKIIKRWWVATGTLDVAALEAELEALKKTTFQS